MTYRYQGKQTDDPIFLQTFPGQAIRTSEVTGLYKLAVSQSDVLFLLEEALAMLDRSTALLSPKERARLEAMRTTWVEHWKG
jgi:hypothetical protein